MRFAEQMGRIRYNMQDGVSRSSKSLFVFGLRLFTGLILGLVFAIAFDEIFDFANLGFVFVTVMGTTSFLYFSRNWGIIPVLIFDLFCVLLSMLIRLYIVVAPGA